MSGPRLIPAFLTVGGWTLVSRLLGFVRDIMIAAFLGAGPVAEAFMVAFSLPNMFRRFFAEGAFNTAFVPMFTRKLQSGDDPRGFGEEALSALATILIALTLAAQLFMPWVVLALASGFAGDERFAMTVHFARVTFPYLLFISLAALLSGVLNALGRFMAAAAAPVVLNVILIAAMAGAQWLRLDIGQTLVWAVSVAGVAQFVLIWMAARRAGMTLRFVRPRVSPELRRLAVLAAPAAMAGGVVQVNLLVGRQVASFYDGAIAWLSYADRLYQLPLGVVGIAIGVVLLPDLSRRVAEGDEAGGREAFNRGTEFTLLLAVPAAVALMVIPLQLVQVLFERGAFDAADSRATAWAVAIYGAGLPAFVLQKVLLPLFFAREDTRRPFRYSLVSLVVNAVLAIGLTPWLGFLAPAIATSVAGWAMVWLLWRGSRGMGEAARADARLRRTAPRILIASAGMGLALAVLAWALGGMLASPGLRFGALALLVAGGMVAYGGLVAALGVITGAELRAVLARKR
jgi:putative peptidoglycan lipid II flippase